MVEVEARVRQEVSNLCLTPALSQGLQQRDARQEALQLWVTSGCQNVQTGLQSGCGHEQLTVHQLTQRKSVSINLTAVCTQ